MGDFKNLCYPTHPSLMTFALVSRFHVINVKALVDAFNQENILVGAFSSIVKTGGSFVALVNIADRL